MIRSFRDAATERLLADEDVPRFRAIERQARRKLLLLDNAGALNDLRQPPGYRLEALKGDRQGQHSIRINDQWRICFLWRDGGAEQVEILAEEFMKPNGISQNRLSRDIDVNPARINDIVHGRSAITAGIALRLGKYFGTTPELWMNLQASYELRLARAKDWPKIERRVRILAAE